VARRQPKEKSDTRRATPACTRFPPLRRRNCLLALTATASEHKGARKNRVQCAAAIARLQPLRGSAKHQRGGQQQRGHCGCRHGGDAAVVGAVVVAGRRQKKNWGHPRRAAATPTATTTPRQYIYGHCASAATKELSSSRPCRRRGGRIRRTACRDGSVFRCVGRINGAPSRPRVNSVDAQVGKHRGATSYPHPPIAGRHLAVTVDLLAARRPVHRAASGVVGGASATASAATSRPTVSPRASVRPARGK